MHAVKTSYLGLNVYMTSVWLGTAIHSGGGYVDPMMLSVDPVYALQPAHAAADALADESRE